MGFGDRWLLMLTRKSSILFADFVCLLVRRGVKGTLRHWGGCGSFVAAATGGFAVRCGGCASDSEFDLLAVVTAAVSAAQCNLLEIVRVRLGAGVWWVGWGDMCVRFA